MTTLKTLISVALTAGILAGCAGRQPDPVDVVQAGDASRSCSDLKLEVATNEDQIKQLLLENARKNARNVGATAVGAVVFLPALFFLDLKGAEKKELDALNQRNLHLKRAGGTKDCSINLRSLETLRQEAIDEQSAQRRAAEQ